MLIAFKDILWAEDAGAGKIEVAYAKPRGGHKFKASTALLKLRRSGDGNDVTAKTIMDHAYGSARPGKRILVLINPHGGQGKAEAIYRRHAAPIFAAARCTTDIVITKRRNHATEIARDVDVAKYDAVVCCSGDGLPHEVLNGFAKRPDCQKVLKTLPLCQLPCGSGNAMAVSLFGHPSPSLAALSIVKGCPMPLDLMYMTQGATTSLSFLSQSYGIVADCDLGTENLRWMGGIRFDLGVLVKTVSGTTYPCEIAVKYVHRDVSQAKAYYERHVDGHSEEDSSLVDPFTDSLALPPPRLGTVNDPLSDDWQKLHLESLSMFYVGNMPYMSATALMFPYALPNDGTLELLHWETSIGRVNSLNTLLDVEKGNHVNNPKISYSKIEAYRLTPKITKGYLSVDGESFPLEPYQVEIWPRAACTLSPFYTYANAAK